jgi:acyl-CoA dehydrogenase
VQTSKWAMEVHGGLGTLQEYRAERWLREAMILAIWEGPAHRQILDGLEVMERKHAHHLLLQSLPVNVDACAAQAMKARIDQHLTLPRDQKEAGAEPLFADLAAFTAHALLNVKP